MHAWLRYKDVRKSSAMRCTICYSPQEGRKCMCSRYQMCKHSADGSGQLPAMRETPADDGYLRAVRGRRALCRESLAASFFILTHMWHKKPFQDPTESRKAGGGQKRKQWLWPSADPWLWSRKIWQLPTESDALLSWDHR